MLIDRQLVASAEFELSEEKINSLKAIISYIIVPMIEWWFK